MRLRLPSPFVLALACLSFAPGAGAKTWTVQVGGTTMSGGDGYYGGGTTNPVLAYSPQQLTISQGDSVTFQNMGGASHNVHADDNSFRCANGCDGDGMGGSGNPSAADWSATVTFTKAGTVSYHCDNHQGMGMVGSIVVNATAPSITLGGYLSGSWYQGPGLGGQGFEIEFTAQSSIVVAYWYVYTPDGSGQTWIYAQGTYDTSQSSVTMPATLLTGAKFPPNFNPADLPATPPDWGTVTFTFSDCNTGTVSWTSGFSTPQGTYASGSMPIHRLTSVAGTSCPQ